MAVCYLGTPETKIEQEGPTTSRLGRERAVDEKWIPG